MDYLSCCLRTSIEAVFNCPYLISNTHHVLITFICECIAGTIGILNLL